MSSSAGQLGWLQTTTKPSRIPGTQVKNIHLDKATLRVEPSWWKRTPCMGPSVRGGLFLPVFCGFMFSRELLKQLDASSRNLKNTIVTRSNAWIWPVFGNSIEIENSLEMVLSKAKSGGAWQSHFWQCGT